MTKRKSANLDAPIWFDGTNINEALFCDEFLNSRKIIFADGAFFTPDGRVTDDLPLRGEIYEELKCCAVNNIPRKITNILEVMKLAAHVEDFAPEADRIHLSNGTLKLDGSFTEGRPNIVRSRLPVAYRPDAPAPERWFSFLDGLLYAEDIPTLQEFIGYCLIPSNKGPRRMVIKGHGGEGKSQIGAVLGALLGSNMKDGSIGKISENRFARADLEHILLCVDDDIQFEDVSFEYPGAETESIQHINLDVKEGEFLVLTGGSGCGKTTLTRLINGLAEQFYEGTLKGRVTLLGRSISEYPLYEIGKKVGSIFQDPKSQFFASITEDEIAFGCENYGVSYEELDGRVSNAIKRINGDMLRGKEIYPMSSGEKQKIAVASVNAVDPEIYVFDEPSANLDMYSVEALKNLMRELKAEGHTIVVAEHRLYYLTDLADRFLYMENGSIKEEWSPEELLSMSENKRQKIGIRAADLRHIEVDIPPREDKNVTLEVKQLAFSYRKHPVFHDISFQVYAGDLIAIVGHNGIGKTTLSNILCGIQKEKTGQVLYNGQEISKGKRKNFAYFVMQNTDCQLFGDSVEEELLLNGKGSTQEQRDDLLKLYGLFEWKDKHPATLSGGQKQRLTLAVSDWIDTPVLLLDEPTSGLDFKNMMRISEHLKALAQKGKTILIITHDYEFAAMTCNRVLHFVDEGHAETFPLQGNLPRLYSCLMCQ